MIVIKYAGDLRLGDRVVRGGESIGVVRAIAWLDEHIYVYYRTDGFDRFTRDQQLPVFVYEREAPHAP